MSVGKVSGGFRGGNWNNNTINARVSDRNNAANTNTNRNNNNGGRCARTSSIHNIGAGAEDEKDKKYLSKYRFKRKPILRGV